MAGTADLNVILTQGDTVKEIHNIRKQVLEQGQQAMVQNSEDRKKEIKSKVQESRSGDRIEIRADEERRSGVKRGKKEDKGEPSESDEMQPVSPSGNLIDIKV